MGLLPIGSGACAQWCTEGGYSTRLADAARDASFDWAKQQKNEGSASDMPPGYKSPVSPDPHSLNMGVPTSAPPEAKGVRGALSEEDIRKAERGVLML